MDEGIKEWQALWQSQKQESLDIEELIAQLNKTERIARFQRVVIPMLFVSALFLMIIHLSGSIYNVISITLIVIGMLLLVVPLYVSRLSTMNTKVNLDNQHFAKVYLRKLKTRMLIPKRYVLVFIFLFILAINIAFWGAFSEEDGMVRSIIHLSTLFIFGVLYKVRNIGMRKYEKHILPLIEKLENIDDR